MTFEEYTQEVERHMERELPFDVYEEMLRHNFSLYEWWTNRYANTIPENLASLIDRDILDREILKAESIDNEN